MLNVHGVDKDNGAENPDKKRGRTALSPPLQIPKNRSTGNLAAHADHIEKARLRFSFDAGSASTEYDALTRSPIITDHDHGLGLSGLRRIRQQHPPRPPTIPSPSNPPSQSPSVTLPRSASMITFPMAMSPGPVSPHFTEDLSRFPSESLHSFSFAHQSEDYIHSRQNVLTRSIDFIKDRRGLAVSPNAAAIASAEARVAGDLETQSMLDLIVKAQLVGGAGTSAAAMLNGPLTGPAQMSGDNVFEKEFIPRTASPDSYSNSSTIAAPKTTPPNSILALPDSENSSRTHTNESGTTNTSSPPPSAAGLKRSLTDLEPVFAQQKLVDAMAQPYMLHPEHMVSPSAAQSVASSLSAPGPSIPAPSTSTHGHSTRWVPAAQAIFTTQAKPPWTILAANDLACLVFGVTKAEVRKMGILEVIQEERREWLEKKLLHQDGEDTKTTPVVSQPQPTEPTSSLLGIKSGITAQLLSKPNSRSQTPKSSSRRAQTVHGADPSPSKGRLNNHHNSQSRGVLLCGDVVPIQKRNGATGSASIWVKEKKVGLIWVVEEIHEDIASLALDDEGIITKASGDMGPIWGGDELNPGIDIGRLIPRIPRQGIDPRFGEIDYAQIAKQKYFTCRNCDRINIPATVEQVRGKTELRVSSFPHIAGIVVVSPVDLTIKSSNSVFCGALFGYEKPDGLPVTNLIPSFDKILRILMDEDGVQLVEGIVVPEHSFRKASAFQALREGRPEAATAFLRPDGLKARHRDGFELRVDVQMRVVKSESQAPGHKETVFQVDESDRGQGSSTLENVAQSEMVYALWITYSRHLHATRANLGVASPLLSGAATPLRQPSPGQTPAHTPPEISDTEEPQQQGSEPAMLAASMITNRLMNVASSAVAAITGSSQPPTTPEQPAQPVKKTINDFVILEDMGQGAYGQVKLARYKREGGQKVVLKYVTKRRILVDTWTRDRRLGTVPLEIHVLDYLRRDGFTHPNIVEMTDFFEDDVNYYIEMVPHGLPGMDLFDYIELRANMEEAEARSIFVQVAQAVHHLHTKAQVVHRDIKDENVILDGEGNIKLIDFGSAAYIKSGPFDVFVGTIDYAAPEVLAGKRYYGKEQDVWALGILLYTIIYKENPFYSIDEIMDRDLRIPWTLSDESINLISHMLERDLGKRYDINQVLDHPWCKALESG